jgi:asparagine synthase (glutamine-hydrolysing)
LSAPTVHVLSEHVALSGACSCGDSRPVSIAVQVFGQLHSSEGLARELNLPRGASHEEIVAAAWLRWGRDSLHRIHGEYAAVISEPHLDQVTLVSDHIGSHRLMWTIDGGCLRFATSIDRLLSRISGRPRPDVASIASFLLSPGSTGPRTFLRGVGTVEAGRLVVIRRGSDIRAERWWRPEDIEQEAQLDREVFRAELSKLLVRAIADRLPPAGSVGAHLSGGIDSTLVTLATKEVLEHRGQHLRYAYAWSPPVSKLDPLMTGRDERTSLTELAGDFGLLLRTSSRSADDMLSFLRRPMELEGTADVFDELPTIAAANDDGVIVLLSGWGGDEVLSAHAPSMPAYQLRKARVTTALRAVRRLNGGTRPVRGLARFTWRRLLLPILPSQVQRITPYYTDLYRGGCYLGPALRSEVPDDATAVRSWISSDPRADVLRILNRGHLGERMSTWRTWAAPFGVRHSYPLTDRRLMERVLSAPTEMLWGDGRSRYPARAVLAGRTRRALSKGDPANERQRMRMSRDTWRILGDEVRAGRMLDDCDWLDMAALRRDLLRGPSGEDLPDALTMARMMPALRVLDLWRRYA